MIRLVFVSAAFAAIAAGQLMVQAGSAADVYHQPTAGCVWSGVVALNAPCVTRYTDDVGQLFYAATPAVLRYTLPAPAGTCDVTITTWEPNKTAAGQRVFSVTTQGQDSGPVDLFALAGLKHPYALMRAAVPVQNGSIQVQLTPMIGNALVSSIQLSGCHPPELPACPLVPTSSIDPKFSPSVMIYRAEAPLSCQPGADALTMIVQNGQPVGIYVLWQNVVQAVAAAPGQDHYQLAIDLGQSSPILITCPQALPQPGCVEGYSSWLPWAR